LNQWVGQHGGPVVSDTENYFMSIDRIVFAVAGFFVLLSVAFGMQMGGANPLFLHEYWLFFTAFVGANLLQSAFTGFCPMVIFLKMFGAKPGQAFN
jgi:hypothetical protein